MHTFEPLKILSKAYNSHTEPRFQKTSSAIAEKDDGPKHPLYNHKTWIFQFSKFFEDRPTDQSTDNVTYKDDYPSSKNFCF